VTLAHVGGVPFEEWLFPLVATGTSITLALRAMMHRLQRTDRQS
jgi:hypothetical protein